MNLLLAKFRIYPKGNWLHFKVFVWKRKTDMRNALAKAKVFSARKCEGCCCGVKVFRVKRNGQNRTTGFLGQIHFCKTSFLMGIITHECTHAAFRWAERTGLVFDQSETERHGLASQQEEEFCWVLGNLARQVVLKTIEQWNYRGFEV